MNELRVAVTGAGGPAGVVTIKALNNISYINTIGMDANPLSAGLKLADLGFVIPLANSDDFIIKLLEICGKERIDVLIPTVDEELLPISENVDKFESVGTKVAISDPETIKTCLDKYLLAKFLDEQNISSPRYYDCYKNKITDRIVIKPRIFRYPVIVKPRKGRGSRNITICKNKYDLKKAVKNIDPFVQEYVKGDEYTIDTLSDFDGKPLVAVPRKRIEIKGGISWKGCIDNNSYLKELAMKTVKLLKIKGASCLQCIVCTPTTRSNERDPSGHPATDYGAWIFEVNPRIGGTTSLTIEAGVDIPLLTIKLLLNKKIFERELELKHSNLYIARYFDDVYFEPNEVL